MQLYMGLTISILTLCLFALYKHITRNFTYWKNLKVPFLTPIPLFGNILDVIMLRTSLGEFILKIHNEMNVDFLGFFIFDQPFLLIRDPQLIKRVLIKDFDHFEDRSHCDNKLDDFSSTILFTIKNPAWKVVRQKLSPIFTSGKIKSMLPLVKDVSETLVSHIKSETIEVRKMCLNYSFDVMTNCAFGINTNSIANDSSEFRKIVNRVFEFDLKTQISMSAHLLAPILVKVFNLHFIDSLAGNYLGEMFIKHLNERELCGSYRGDFIDLLIELRKNNVNYLEEKILVAQAVQFITGGYETSGTTLAFLLYSVARHPNIQEKLRKEFKEVLSKGERLKYEDLEDLKLLDRVVKETLRMYPVLNFLDRRCNKSYRIPGTDVVIQKGIPVYISVLGFNYDSKNFPNPNEFDPDRYLRDTNNDLAFGDGPHRCIGSRFALMTLKVATIHILTKFEVETCSQTPDPMRYESTAILLAPKDGKLYLKFKNLLRSE